MHGTNAPMGQFAVDLAPITLPPWPLIAPQVGIPHGVFGGFSGISAENVFGGVNGGVAGSVHAAPRGPAMHGSPTHGMPMHAPAAGHFGGFGGFSQPQMQQHGAGMHLGMQMQPGMQPQASFMPPPLSCS